MLKVLNGHKEISYAVFLTILKTTNSCLYLFKGCVCYIFASLFFQSKRALVKLGEMFSISLQKHFLLSRKSNFRILDIQISQYHLMPQHKTRDTFYWITWPNFIARLCLLPKKNVFRGSFLGTWWCHDIWISEKLKFDYLKNKKSFWSELKNIFCFTSAHF